MSIREDILALVVEYSTVDPRHFDPSDVFIGNGIEGDDADELLKAFAEAFDVDLSQFIDYFHFVGDEPPMGRREFPVDADGKVIPFWPVTLDMLVDAAEAGHWTLVYPEHEVRTSLWWRVFEYGALALLLVAAPMFIAYEIVKWVRS